MSHKNTPPSRLDGAAPAGARNISNLHPKSLNARSVVCPPGAPYSGTIRRTRPLTDRQREVLAYIAGHVRAFGSPPTLRETGTALGIKSTNAVNDHLKALEAKGCLVRRRDKSRTMQLTEAGWKAAVGGDLVHPWEQTLAEYVAEQCDAWEQTLRRRGMPAGVQDEEAYIDARQEAVSAQATAAHRVAVVDAWYVGVDIPTRVLADYPELGRAA